MTGPCVYRAYDKSLTLRYVGSTSDFEARVAEHFRNGAPWVGVKLYWTVEIFPNIAAARVAEKRAIQAEHPLENKTWRVKGWADPAYLSEIPTCALITTRSDARDAWRRRIFADYSHVITPRSAARVARTVFSNPVLDARRSRRSS